MRKIELIKDYYENGVNIFSKKYVNIEPGVTVLVGCNGYGKSTLFSFIKEALNKDKIKYIYYDDRSDGKNLFSSALFYGNMEFAATSMCSSEGERIVMNLGTTATQISNYIKKHDQEEYWILLDAIDSGLSIDNILDVKEYLFNTILKDERVNGKQIYIVVSANEYEMARGEKCLDIYNCKYREFKTYDSYRKFILKSREIKNKRYPDKE